MADVNEECARAFFESCNFLVRTNVTYYFQPAGNVGNDSDIDLVVCNVNPDIQYAPPNFVLLEEDLKGIHHASVECKGWHNDNFTPSLINENPDIFNFARPEAVTKAAEVLGTNMFKKILIVSSLSPNQPYRQNSIHILLEHGIDHVIEFQTIVAKLWNVVQLNKDYKSEILQTIRLIKKYH